MNEQRGWYSTIQYATDEGDRVNIGVLLHVPGTGELAVRFAPFRRRLQHFVPDESAIELLTQETESLREWARLNAGRVDREDLAKSFEGESGVVRFQPLRAVRVHDGEADISRLCRDLVGDGSSSGEGTDRPIDLILERLDEKLRPLEEEHRLHFRTRVRIPDFDILMPVHYQYRNGMDTYVIAEAFGGNKRVIFDRAATLAIRGRQLVRGTHGQARLAVIRCYEDMETRSQTDDSLVKLFAEHQVESIPDDRVDEFVEDVRAHAQPWF